MFRSARSDRDWKLRGAKSRAMSRAFRSRRTRRSICEDAPRSRRPLRSAGRPPGNPPGPEKILRKILAVRLKRNDSGRARRQFRLQQARQAIKANGNFRSRGFAAQSCLASKIERIRNIRGHPVMPVFQMDALRGPAHQPRPQPARMGTNGYSRISLVHAESRHVRAMVSESGTALEKIRYHEGV